MVQFLSQLSKALTNNFAAFLLTVFVILIFLYTCVDRDGFFSVKSILKYYFTVFEKPKDDSEKLDVHQKKKTYYLKPIIFNFVLPLLLGIILGLANPINDNIITFMSTVVSIWIAILFALIAVLQSLAKEKLGEDYYLVVKQAYATVMFECCISVFTVILGFIYIILCPEKGIGTTQCPTNIILYIFGIIIYTLLFILLLTMFMIFKKCNALLGEIIRANETQKRDVTLINISKSILKIQESLEKQEKKK